MTDRFTFVVIGGGIAGISCVETLFLLNKESDVLLVTKSEVVKTVSSAIHITKTIVELKVEESNVKRLKEKHPNLKILIDSAIGLNHSERSIQTEGNGKLFFEKLCICAGGKANLIADSNPHVIGIRDTESVVEFEKRIGSSRRILIVGNGGIASEIIHQVRGVDKIWAMKDDHISKTFLDAGAGEFFLQGSLQKEETGSTLVKRIGVSLSEPGGHSAGPALGPGWHTNFNLSGSRDGGEVTLEFNARVTKIESSGDGEWPVRVELSNGSSHGVDFVVSATGVAPNSEVFSAGNENLDVAEDGGIVVDWKMETSLKDVFAAGDVCTAGWKWAPHWHQMKLWTQAKQMGCYAAECMAASLTGETVQQDFSFELFSHVTNLFGFKVVLLGLFNGQKLGGEYELLLRVTKGREYVKIVLKEGKMQGALLVGETDLEETCENLILSQLDLTPFGEDFLNPDIDIEDYFD